MNIGKTIKEYRIKNEITQRELAKKLNRNIRTIQKYESNEIKVPLENLIIISDVLNIPYSELISDKKIINILKRGK